MFLSKCIRNLTAERCRYFIATRLLSNTAIDIEKIEKESIELDVVDEDAQLREAELERKRNKSRLYSHHRSIVHNEPPYKEAKLWTHGTLKYQRKLYGKYGEASGVNPMFCWPTKQELQDRQEYEQIAYPYTIQEMAEVCKTNRLEKQEKIRQRQEDIVKKVQKLDVWSKELKERIARKETEAKAVKDKKDKLIDDVRRHFGYTVDPRDERFKEMLERKEKEQKKAAKEARKKQKEEKMMHKLLQTKETPENIESK